MRFWPRGLNSADPELSRSHLEIRRELIRGLSAADLQFQALKLLEGAEKAPNAARAALFSYFAARLESLPLLEDTDQRQVELILDSLLPDDFDLRFECPKCFGLSACGCKS